MTNNGRRSSRTLIKVQLFAVLLLLIPALVFHGSVAPASAQSASRTFPQTGKTVNGTFLTYWDQHGGLAQQGYPISDQMQETNETDNKTYTVQYFERAVFELHPENKAPYDVLLSLLGTFTYKQKYPNGAPGQTVNSSAGAVKFPETRHTLGGIFLTYWQQHGGLAQQGYPISEEFQEKSDLNGQTYLVQYFERAVFEYHPENQPPYNVLLSQLGTTRYNKLYKVDHIDTFERVWAIVRDNYVYTDFRGLDWNAVHTDYLAKLRNAPTEDAAYKLIADMINKLGDGHSGFLDPQRTKEDDLQQQGKLQFSGIGVFVEQVVVQNVDQGVRIIMVVPGGPADKAGLRPYDVITAANGTPIGSADDATGLIRGPAGTHVKLTVQSPGKSPRDVDIVRQSVDFTFHPTTKRLPGTNIVFLYMPSFYQFGIANEAKQALLDAAAAGPVDGLIIDERQNGGGFLSELVDTEKLFINGGIAGYESSRTSRTADTIPAGATLPAYRGKPIVVLTSELCESACERFAVAMHDLHRATIVGKTTAGNTETVFPYDLPDGSRLSLAQETFQRPDGASIEDKGLAPDQVVDVPWYEYATQDDPQVLAAEKVIQQK